MQAWAGLSQIHALALPFLRIAENSDALLKFGRNNATMVLAQQIITTQKMDIRMLQDLLLANKKY